MNNFNFYPEIISSLIKRKPQPKTEINTKVVFCPLSIMFDLDISLKFMFCCSSASRPRSKLTFLSFVKHNFCLSFL